MAAAVSGVATYEGRGVGTARVACADVYCVRPCERDRHGRNAVFQEAGGETGLPVQRLCLRFPEHVVVGVSFRRSEPMLSHVPPSCDRPFDRKKRDPG